MVLNICTHGWTDIPMFVHRLNMIKYIRNWFPK